MLERNPQRGFSLFEILIALSIIAILTAVLLPSVNQQISKSNAARAANDLVAVQTALQAFIADVHRVPANIGQLRTRITTSDSDLGVPTPANYPDYIAAYWRGPYLVKDVLTSTEVGTISNTLTTTSVGTPATTYVTVTMTNVSFTDFQGIEAIIDEGTAPATSTTLGAIRFSGTSTLTFLAVPYL